MGPLIIPFVPNNLGRVWINVNMLTKDRKSLEKIRFKLDSGSDFTTINVKDLGVLGYTQDFLKTCPFHENYATTASDNIKFSLQYITDISLRFEDREIKGCRIFFSLGTGLRSLLGCDILKYFDWEVNYTSGEFRLKETLDKPQLSKGESLLQIYSLEDIALY